MAFLTSGNEKFKRNLKIANTFTIGSTLLIKILLLFQFWMRHKPLQDLSGLVSGLLMKRMALVVSINLVLVSFMPFSYNGVY